jgi:hypothetical protein
MAQELKTLLELAYVTRVKKYKKSLGSNRRFYQQPIINKSKRVWSLIRGHLSRFQE